MGKEFRKSHIEKGEKQYLQNLLSQANGNVKKAAQMSGLSVPRLYELFRKHQIATRSP